MLPTRYDIHWVRLQFGKCDDTRRCVILAAAPGGKVSVAAISAQWDLFNRSQDLEIDDSSPDFAETGLSRRSYVSGKLQEVDVSDVEKRAGRFTGGLLDELKSWIGD